MQLTIWTAANGAILADWTPFVQDPQVSTNEHGDASLSATIQMSPAEALSWYERLGAQHLELSDMCCVIWQGRLEDVSLTAGGIQITAMGYWRAFTDLPYTAMWSETRLDRFRPVTRTELSNRTPDRYEITIQDDILISPKKGETFGGNAGPAPLPAIASVIYEPVVSGTQQIAVVQFDLLLDTTASWHFICYRVNRAMTTFNTVFSLVSPGSVLNRAIYTTLTADDRLMFDLYLDTAGTAVLASDTGTVNALIYHIRMTPSSTNDISTTLTAVRAAGTAVTATVGSTTGMYAGQRLTINSGNNPSESLLVTSVTNSTQFVATFVNAYAIGNAVQGPRILADRILTDMVSAVATVNTTQLRSSTTFIQSPGLDLTDAVYEDADMTSTINEIVNLGDNQTTPRVWQAMTIDRALCFAPQGDSTVSRSWLIEIDPESFTAQQTLESVINSVYATYTDADDLTQRTAATEDTVSISRFGLTRRVAVQSDTTTSTQATTTRDMALADRKRGIPRVKLTVRRVLTAYGATARLWDIRAGDQASIINMPILGGSLDQLQTFYVSETNYNFGPTIEVTPASPPPRLAVIDAQKKRGLRT
jgi:hypothetical protein